jgi:hypothetical protein
MNKLTSATLTTLFSASLIAPLTAAEVITLPIGEQTRQSDLDMPVRSMNKQDVQRDYGDPQEITDAVGEPPISQWVYGDYVVYFEGNWVLYSVVKHPSDNPQG